MNVNNSVSLKTFYDFSHGSHNMGQLRLTEGGQGLEKVNNYIFRTSKNNVQLSAAENFAVRQALVNALSATYASEYVAQLRQLLLGGANKVESLNRDFVKIIIDGAEQGESVDSIAAKGKLLSERKITFDGDRAVYTAGVTSTKEIAYEKSISEELDSDFAKMRNNLSKFNQLPPIGDERLRGIKKAWNGFYCSLSMAFSDDKRLDDATRERLGNQLDLSSIKSIIVRDLGESFDGLIPADECKSRLRSSFLQFMEQSGLSQEIVRDYTFRVFPDSDQSENVRVETEKMSQDIDRGLQRSRDAIETLDRLPVGDRHGRNMSAKRAWTNFYTSIRNTLQGDLRIDATVRNRLVGQLNKDGVIALVMEGTGTNLNEYIRTSEYLRRLRLGFIEFMVGNGVDKEITRDYCTRLFPDVEHFGSAEVKIGRAVSKLRNPVAPKEGENLADVFKGVLAEMVPVLSPIVRKQTGDNTLETMWQNGGLDAFVDQTCSETSNQYDIGEKLIKHLREKITDAFLGPDPNSSARNDPASKTLLERNLASFGLY